ncbi:MAG: hypothetical protein AAFQ02_06020 [Bacteroidota bacterium]
MATPRDGWVDRSHRQIECCPRADYALVSIVLLMLSPGIVGAGVDFVACHTLKLSDLSWLTDTVL